MYSENIEKLANWLQKHLIFVGTQFWVGLSLQRHVIFVGAQFVEDLLLKKHCIFVGTQFWVGLLLQRHVIFVGDKWFPKGWYGTNGFPKGVWDKWFP